MAVHKICNYLLEVHNPQVITCPKCRSRKLEVVVVKRDDRRLHIVKLVCRSDKCGKQVVFDVTHGIVSR